MTDHGSRTIAGLQCLDTRRWYPTKVDVNAQYAGLEYHYVYIMTCSFVVWLILPGIGLLYSGLARRKSALTLLFQSWMILSVYVPCFSRPYYFVGTEHG
jgi:hypothetical protein